MKRALIVSAVCWVMLWSAMAAQAMTLREFRTTVSDETLLNNPFRLYRAALEAAGSDTAFKAEVYYEMARDCVVFRRPAEARAVAEKALKVLPEEFHSRPYVNLAQAAAIEKKPEEAKRYLLLAADSAADPDLRKTLRDAVPNATICAAAVDPNVPWMAFETNRPEAEKNYIGKELTLLGNIVAINNWGPFVIAFDSYRDSSGQPPNVACIIDPTDKRRFDKLKPWTTVVVAGTCFGKYRDLLVFGNCRIIDVPVLFGKEIPMLLDGGNPRLSEMRKAYGLIRGKK